MRYANRLCCITTTQFITTAFNTTFFPPVFKNCIHQHHNSICNVRMYVIANNYLQTTFERIYLLLYIWFIFFKLLEFCSQWKNSCSFSPIFFDFRCMVCIGEISTFHQRYFISNINQLLNVIAILRKWMSSSIIIQMKCEKNVSPVGFHI